jgi:hypothetical protein
MDRIDLSEMGLSENPSEGESEPAAAPARMRLAPDPGGGAAGRQRAVPVPGGGFRIACPACGRAESVSEPAFARLGFAVTADCPCGHRFPVLRERRGFYRKPVGLEGFFAEGLHADPDRAAGVVSGPVRVTNLSRTGVELTSARMGLLREGDRLTLRFRLDNSAETVILRVVRIVSLNGDRAGCRFEGEDPSDVALGFYFL